MTKKSNKKSRRRKVNKSKKFVFKKSRTFSPIRFSQPRICKVSSKDPSNDIFSKRLWLKSKIGNGKTYSLGSLERTFKDIENLSDFYVLKKKENEDFETITTINEEA